MYILAPMLNIKDSTYRITSNSRDLYGIR